VVDRDLADGYWIQAVDITGDGRPDLATSGLAVGDVFWYENPGWRKRPVATFPTPVALDAADIDGDGRNDLVISHDYGDCMFNCKPEDGRISWMRNPGTYDGTAPGRSGTSPTAWPRTACGWATSPAPTGSS
jgi:hypothetical protein